MISDLIRVVRGCGKMVKFAKERQFGVTINVRARGKFTNGRKDSEESGKLFVMCALGWNGQ
jgi:hypothetical protein